jgi:curved DNA-binding protein CbpA
LQPTSVREAAVTSSRIRELGGADPYELLSVDRLANRDAIVAAYRRRIVNAHPDRGGDEEAAKLIHLARDVLLDPQLRDEYDRMVAPSECDEDEDIEYYDDPLTATDPVYPYRSGYVDLNPPAPARGFGIAVVALLAFPPVGLAVLAATLERDAAIRRGDRARAHHAASHSRKMARIAFIIGPWFWLVVTCCGFLVLNA